MNACRTPVLRCRESRPVHDLFGESNFDERGFLALLTSGAVSVRCSRWSSSLLPMAMNERNGCNLSGIFIRSQCIYQLRCCCSCRCSNLLVATAIFPNLLLSVDFVLFVATVSALAAAFLGWSLARSGSYSGWLVTQHMWSGILVAVCAWLCWWLRARKESRFHLIYALRGDSSLLAWCLLPATAAANYPQGENHLTEYMPTAFFATGLAIPGRVNVDAGSANGRPGTFYAASIQPVFTNHCVSCHGAAKHKNNLRLNSYDAVMRGGKHGAVIKAGDAKGSELFRRISLSPSSDDFMPSDNKPPLTEN